MLQTEDAAKRASGKLLEDLAGYCDTERSDRGWIMPFVTYRGRRVGSSREVWVRVVQVCQHAPRGKQAPLSDEEPVSGDGEGGVMMEASPAAAFEVAESEFLFELLIVAFYDPTLLGDPHQLFQLDLDGQVRQPVFGWLGRAFGPLDQEPFLGMRLTFLVIPMRGADTDRREPGVECFAALPPADLFPCRPRQRDGQRLGADRLMILIAAQQFWRPPPRSPGLGRQGLLARLPNTHRRFPPPRIFQLKFPQASPELTVHAIGGICQNDTARDILRHRLSNLIEGNPRLGLKLNLFRSSCLFPARVIVAPTLRHVQPVGHRHAPGCCRHRQTHGYTAVFLFP